jgi:hypothetical protein
MLGNKYPIHEALIDLVVNREKGKSCYAQFKCQYCSNMCTIPRHAESKSSLMCCKCSEINYLDGYEVVIL